MEAIVNTGSVLIYRVLALHMYAPSQRPTIPCLSLLCTAQQCYEEKGFLLATSDSPEVNITPQDNAAKHTEQVAAGPLPLRLKHLPFMSLARSGSDSVLVSVNG
jgi:hypothetical protein